jgi:DNA-binding NtrC family response regulator
MKARLEAIIAHTRSSGMLYNEAVREFRKAFVTAVLRDKCWNRCKTARQLEMHRNTLSRLTAELHIEMPTSRHGPRPASTLQSKQRSA